MKREINHRQSGNWDRIDWSLDRSLTRVEVVQGRVIGNPKDAANAFVQITVVVTSKQRFAAYDRKGALVAGNPEQAIDVRDAWVLERSLRKDGLEAQWHLAGRLELQGQVKNGQKVETQFS
eukprot:evm.model.scf_822.1 EVM.evm.TU.scf_822.1   scf_822:682-1044(+)